jgi:hypothetical protein
MVQIGKPDKTHQPRWCSMWGYADSQGFGIATSLGLAEFVDWDEADRVLVEHVDKFAKQEQADHDAINPQLLGVTPEAVELLERRLAEARPRGQEWGVKVESVTGHQYMFTIEWDGAAE